MHNKEGTANRGNPEFVGERFREFCIQTWTEQQQQNNHNNIIIIQPSTLCSLEYRQRPYKQ